MPRYSELAGKLNTANEFRYWRGTGEERLGRINAMIRTAGWTASSFLPHHNTAIDEEPDDVAQASGRAAVREAAHGRNGRNDEVLAEPE